jgi:hypothetical protein
MFNGICPWVIVHNTIIFQDKLRSGIRGALDFARYCDYALDNSICYADESLFLTWAKLMNSVDTFAGVDLFHVLVQTGAKHVGRSIFCALPSSSLTTSVVQCLLQVPSLFPRCPEVGCSALAHVIYAQQLHPRDSRFELQLYVHLLWRDLITNVSTEELYRRLNCQFKCHHPSPRYPIMPLALSIVHQDYKLLSVLLLQLPIQELNFFVPYGDVPYTWESAEQWISSSPSAIASLINNARTIMKQHFLDVRTLLNRFDQNTIEIILQFLHH